MIVILVIVIGIMIIIIIIIVIVVMVIIDLPCHGAPRRLRGCGRRQRLHHITCDVCVTWYEAFLVIPMLGICPVIR